MRHTSSLLVTLQDSLSPPQIDMFASYRSFKGQSQVCASWNIRKAQIIRLRDVPERFFCRRKSANALAHRFETLAQQWRFPEKTPSCSHSMPSKASKNVSVCSAFSCDGWDTSDALLPSSSEKYHRPAPPSSPYQ